MRILKMAYSSCLHLLGYWYEMNAPSHLTKMCVVIYITFYINTSSLIWNSSIIAELERKTIVVTSNTVLLFHGYCFISWCYRKRFRVLCIFGLMYIFKNVVSKSNDTIMLYYVLYQKYEHELCNLSVYLKYQSACSLLSITNTLSYSITHVSLSSCFADQVYRK